jgi:replicative DNA helicase
MSLKARWRLDDEVERDVHESANPSEGKTTTIKELVKGAINTIELPPTTGKAYWFTTGLQTWTNSTGLHPAEMIVIAARPSVGKHRWL